MRAEYGDDEHNFYAADTFNEMDPGTNDPAYLRNASSAVYNARAALPYPPYPTLLAVKQPGLAWSCSARPHPDNCCSGRSRAALSLP